MKVDIYSDLGALVETWRAVGRRVAVAIGALVALLSLVSDAPVRIASWRGALAWAAVLAVTSVGAWFAHRTWVEPTSEPGESSSDEGQLPLGR